MISNTAQCYNTNEKTMLFILIAIVFAFIFYFLCLKPFNYWKRVGVPQYSCWIILRETFLAFIPYRSVSENVQKFYEDFRGKRYFGNYHLYRPGLMIRDYELIKQVTVKDFDHFVDHVQILPDNIEPMWQRNLFSLKGDMWKDMRATLSPSFTSSKMKILFSLISDYAKGFVEYFEKQPGVITLEMKDTFTRFTNDVIATSAFGVSCDSMRNPNNEFYLMGKELTNFKGFYRNAKMVTLLFFPRVAKFFRINVFPKTCTEFFSNLVKENIKSRQKNGVIRPDMIHLLMEARNERNEEHDPKNGGEKRVKRPLTDDDILAQALIFFFAGFESVATLMCFVAHELAVNVDVQERLQNEIDDALAQCNGNLTYEALSQMKYMDMVVSETQRKWPSVVAIDRVCVKPYTIEPINDTEQPVHVEKGQAVWVPVFGLHRDVDYFPDPERFDPERFNDDNKSKIPPYVYLPFGTGPRVCIGNRFALMETKLLFFYVLAKFNIVVVDKTDVPLKLARSPFLLTSRNGFWLGLKSRN